MLGVTTLEKPLLFVSVTWWCFNPNHTHGPSTLRFSPISSSFLSTSPQTLMAVQWSNVTNNRRFSSQDETMASTSLDHAISVRTHPSILANLHPEVRDEKSSRCAKNWHAEMAEIQKIPSWYGKHSVRNMVFIMPSRFWCYKLQWWYPSTSYRSIMACPTWGLGLN